MVIFKVQRNIRVKLHFLPKTVSKPGSNTRQTTSERKMFYGSLCDKNSGRQTSEYLYLIMSKTLQNCAFVVVQNA